jgi:hypothetical protein
VLTDKVRAICFPRVDLTFDTHVRELLEAVPDRAPLWAAVEATLRETYPLALISPRMGFAALDAEMVWYVYRDGTFLGPLVPDAT